MIVGACEMNIAAQAAPLSSQPAWMPIVDTTQFVKWVFRLSLVVSLATSLDALAQEEPAVESSTDSAGAAGSNTGLNLDMKLDDLVKQDVVIPGFSQEVSTVERQKSTIGRTPAAVFVITPEMIKRSGARNLPDVLRMAPGVDVARIASDIWAISIRGFNDRFADKLLVQIDGRVVYTATFGGVIWNQQDVVLADVERIEVIRGPGTTMWGSNAVNGVINIITKKSSETQGLLIQSAGGGEQTQDFNMVRYGGRVGEDLTWRVFGQQFDNSPSWSTTDVPDAWHMKHGGFRMDYTPTKEDTITLQGDLYSGLGTDNDVESRMTPPFGVFVSDPNHFMGGNILFRYEKVLDEDTSWQVQTYYDQYRCLIANLPERRDTYDIDLQWQFRPWEYHHFITGANYRNSPNVTNGNFTVALIPDDFVTQWASVFAQDTMTLEEDRWYFTLGTRLEYNTFGKFQPEPTARLLFLPSERQSMWAAISRAARNPSRIDRQLDVHKHFGAPNDPTFLNILGDSNFQPENLLAYEIGYRAAPTDDFSWDIAGYINDYHKVRGYDGPGPPVVVPPGLVFVPITFANDIRALSYGGELTATLQLNDDWRLFGSYSLFEVHCEGDPLGVAQLEGSSPHNMVYLRSSWDLTENIQFDLIGRYVDRLSALDVPKYFQMDARIGLYATKNLEFSFVGQNLLDGHHLEFIDAISQLAPTEVQRSWYAMVSWTY
jgi:iron complex outermembrane receptor protein